MTEKPCLNIHIYMKFIFLKVKGIKSKIVLLRQPLKT